MFDRSSKTLLGRAGIWLTVVVLSLPLLPAFGQEAPKGLPGAPTVPAVIRAPDGRIEATRQDNADARQPQHPPAPAPSTDRRQPPRAAPPSRAAAAPPPVVPRTSAETPQRASPRLQCASGAITCAEVVGQAHPVQGMPVTFGQPFRQGDVPPGAVLTAVDQYGNAIPLQLDAKNTFADGSLRFSVLSALLPHMKAGEHRIVSLRLAKAGSAQAALSPPEEGPNPDISVSLRVFSRQISIVKFGNRVGPVPGFPFQAGETIAINVGDEVFTLTVTPDMAGGTGVAYTNIAKAFVPLINSQSKKFKAFRIEAGDGYEKLRITTVDAIEKFNVSYNYSGIGKIEISNYIDAEYPSTWTATLPPDTSGKMWLNGPVAREQDVIVPFRSKESGETHPNLTARIHLRRYPQAKAWRADVIVENGWAYQAGARNYTYDATIRVNGQEVQQYADIPHYHHSRWHKVIWSPGFAEPVVALNVPYFVATPMVLHYDSRLTIPEQTIAHDVERLQHYDTRPMGTAEVLPYMPTTGGRGDIGPLPRWSVVYLLSMDPRAKAIMLANADAGAGIPIHYREKKSDFPISLDEHPTVAMGPGQASARDTFPPIKAGDTPWTAQIAHHPSLFYLPYLVTGDLFYLEEQLFWGTWVLASPSPGYRGEAQALVHPNEVRGQAWSLRTLGETVAALPDGHPLKAYFAGKVDNNLRWYVANYMHNPDLQNSPFRSVIPKTDQLDIVVPWQQDYMIMAFGFLAQLGYEPAADMARWLMRFSVTLWNSDADGFCHQMAAPYVLKIQDASHHYVATWKEAFQLNWPNVQSCPADFVSGYPQGAAGYIANAYAMLAIAVDLGYADAAEVLARLRRETPQMQRAFADDPTFAIVPRIGTSP